MELDIPLFQGLSLNIHDTPPAGKEYPTTRLQKGFVLLDRGEELTEEAVGFGVPVLQSGLQTIFPGGIELTWLQRDLTWDITALFRMNLVEKFSQGENKNLENKILYAAKNFLAAEIRRLPKLRGFLTSISNQMRRLFRWETIYTDAGFSTELKVFYSLDTGTGKILVEIDTTGLPLFITEVMLMNEQGAQTFDRFQDSSGIFLQGNEIGCWDEISAQEAWFESSTRQVAFKLGQVKGARLFRGRELVGSRLAWAGFGYSFPPSVKKFRYEMRKEKRT
jgi:hypothetical protein